MCQIDNGLVTKKRNGLDIRVYLKRIVVTVGPSHFVSVVRTKSKDVEGNVKMYQYTRSRLL